jgi:hypothetical protein
LDYFRTRWHGAVPLRQILVREMLLVGTVINLAFGFVALMMVARGAAGIWAAAVHFAPLPYNLFLLGAVLRSPEARTGSSVVALAWFAVMVVV